MTHAVSYVLSNLAADRQFELSVAEGADVLAAAHAHLEESGLPTDVQRGFFLSVYPHPPADEVGVTAGAAAPEHSSDHDHDHSGGNDSHDRDDDEAILA